jgi:hypothetical protein
MVFRYLRQLEGVSPPLGLAHYSCQLAAKIWVSTCTYPSRIVEPNWFPAYQFDFTNFTYTPPSSQYLIGCSVSEFEIARTSSRRTRACRMLVQDQGDTSCTVLCMTITAGPFIGQETRLDTIIHVSSFFVLSFRFLVWRFPVNALLAFRLDMYTVFVVQNFTQVDDTSQHQA